MANTYTQIHVQLVFAVKYREGLIIEEYREAVEKYLCGIVSNNKSKPLAVYCNPDHVHLFFGLHPTVSISEMARLVKANSSKWINEKDWFEKPFSWQNGYGAFTYSKSHVGRVVKYILNQREHHRKQTFRDEFLELLDSNEIDFDLQYTFDFFD